MYWRLSWLWLIMFCRVFFRKWISRITVWQKWRICQPFHLLVNWIWDVSLLTDIYIHPCARELTHTYFLCICLFLCSFLKPLLRFSVLLYDNVDRNVLNKGFTFECKFPLCIILNVSTQTTVSVRSVVLSNAAISLILTWNTTGSRGSAAWTVCLLYISAL